LGEKAKVKETVSLYSKVWRLPTFQGIIVRISATVLLAASLASVSKFFANPGSDFIWILGQYLMLTVIPSFLGTALLYAIVRKRGSPLDTRRTAGAVQFGILFWMITGVLGGLLDYLLVSNHYEVRFWMLGLGIAYTAFAFLVTGLSDHHPIRNFVAALMIPILWYLEAFALGGPADSVLVLPPLWLAVAAVTLFVYSLAVHFIFRSVSVPFERDLGINGPELLRAFGYDYLMDNSEPIEKTLTQIGEKQDVPVEVVVFRNDLGLVGVGVVQYVHPGPFRQIGSSSLPSAIMDHIRQEHCVPAFVMHGSCTHQQNLTTKDDFSLIMAEIDRLIRETEVHDTASGPHWSDLGKFKVWTLFVGDDVLTISTSAPEFTDDISLDVGREAANVVRDRVPQVNSVAVVDAHNCIDGDAVSVMPGDIDAGEYVGAVSSAVFATFDAPRSRFSAGFHQVIPESISPEEGLGPGGVTAMVLMIGSRQVVMLSVDGNNMEPGFREEAIRILKTQGFDDAEVLTTDTHVVNAISTSSRGYPPVGQHRPQETLEAIVRAANSAREQVSEVRIGLGFGEAKSLRTFGEKGFDILTQDITEAAGIAKRVGIRAGVAAFLLAVLLTFLL
jgi:putative membrane protein